MGAEGTGIHQARGKCEKGCRRLLATRNGRRPHELAALGIGPQLRTEEVRQLSGSNGKHEATCTAKKRGITQAFMYISAVICSEINPIRKMITEALKTSRLMFVNRPIVK